MTASIQSEDGHGNEGTRPTGRRTGTGAWKKWGWFPWIAASKWAADETHLEQIEGPAATLARLRDRLRARGLRLLLDFVPNHTGMDHPWVQAPPEYYVAGTDDDLARAPQNYKKTSAKLDLTRELIAVGVAVTTQCAYCIADHAKRAVRAGASKSDVAEAIMIATALRAGGGITHGWKAMKSIADTE